MRIWKPTFYHINYRTYPTGTKVVSFSNEQFALWRRLI
jgi:hypothetical protein